MAFGRTPTGLHVITPAQGHKLPFPCSVAERADDKPAFHAFALSTVQLRGFRITEEAGAKGQRRGRRERKGLVVWVCGTLCVVVCGHSTMDIDGMLSQRCSPSNRALCFALVVVFRSWGGVSLLWWC